MRATVAIRRWASIVVSKKNPCRLPRLPVATRSFVCRLPRLPVATRSFVSLGWRPQQSAWTPLGARSLFIQTQDTPNPLSMKFLPGKPVLDEADAMQFKNYQEAQVSPLAKAIFKIDGVTGVFLGGSFLSVSIGKDSDWLLMKPHIFGAITDFYASGKPVIDTAREDQADTLIEEDDDEVVALIKELIETRIRSFVQEDGGDIVFRKFEDGIVYVELQGSCVGCPSSSATLKHGIENMLMHYIPEVEGVENMDAEEGGDAELQSTSDEELRKLNEGLSKVQGHPAFKGSI